MFNLLGADDVIAFNCDDNIYELEERDLLLKELSIRKPYDVIFLTTSTAYNKDFIKSFISASGILIDAVEKPLASDEYGFFMRKMCWVNTDHLDSFVFWLPVRTNFAVSTTHI